MTNFQSRVVIGSDTFNASNSNLFAWRISLDINTFWRTAQVEIPKNYDSSIDNGDVVTITRGTDSETTTTVFYGKVEGKRVDGRSLILTCVDPLYALQTTFANTSYTDSDSFAGRFDLIIKDLLETYGGLTADVLDLSTAETLRKLILINEPVYETVVDLMKVFDLHMYYEPSDNTVYVNYKGSSTFGTVFTTGSNINGVPLWSTDTFHAYNSINIVGGKIFARTQETFSGDGNETNFTLTYTPIDVKVTVDGVENTQGRPYSTTTYDYVVDNDPNVKQVQFKAASTPGAGVDNIVVDYSYNIPIDVTVDDPSSQTQLGLREKKIFKQSIVRVLDAENLAYAILDKYKNGFTSVSFQALNLTTLPKTGEFASITDMANNRSGTYLITKVEVSYPEAVTKITIGEVYRDVEDFARTINERIKELEKEAQTNTDKIRKNYRPIIPIYLKLGYYMISYPSNANTYWGMTTWGGGNWDGWVGHGDTFTYDNTTNNWNEVAGTWAIDTNDHTYNQTNTGVDALSLWKYSGYNDFTDFCVDVQLRYLGNGTEAGVVFRYNTSTNVGYAVRFKNTSTIALGTYAQATGTFTELDTGSYTTTSCRWYYMKILVYDDNIVVQLSTDNINWVDVIDYDDTTYTSGAIGLLTNDCDAEFHRFRIGELEAAKVIS